MGNKSLTSNVYPAEKGKERKKCRKWYLQVQLPAESKDGKIIYPKKRKTFHGSYREAVKAAEEFRTSLEYEIKDFGNVPSNRYFLKDYCNEFYQLRAARDNLEKKSLDRLKHALDNLLLVHDNVLLTQITTMSLNKALIELKNGHSLSKKKLSPSTLSKYLMYWKQMLEQAYEDGLIDKNPASRLKQPKGEKPIKKALTIKQSNELIAQLDPTQRSEIGIVVALRCGLRQSEILNLQWKDINFKTNILKVTKSKTQAGIRKIPMMDEACKCLQIRKEYCKKEVEEYNSLQTNEKHKLKMTDNWYVCGGTIGLLKPNANLLSTWWKRNYEKLGIEKGFTLHELRHTFATHLAEAGVHPSVMQKMLGHSTSKMSLEVYTHVNQDDLALANEKFQSLFK